MTIRIHPFIILGLLSLCARGLLAAQQPEVRALHPFDEDRVTVDTKNYPFSAIGRLNAAGIDRRSHCTATLITPDHILTAAHCIYFGARKRWFLPSELNFLAGYQRGEFIEHGKIVEVTTKGSYNPDFKSDRSGDWAILKLTKSSDIQPIPLIPTSQDQDRGRFQQSGYHRQRQHVQTLNPDCKIIERKTALFLHDCMLAPGDSGSPILYLLGSRYYVAGLNTSSLQRTGHSGSLGLAISSDVFENALKD